MVARKNMTCCLAAILDLSGGGDVTTWEEEEGRKGLASASRQMARS